jgi:hypothetical protein
MKLRLLLSGVLLFSAAAAFGQGPAYPYSVALNWTVSTTATVTGQNVYRAPWALPSGPCGVLFVKINSAPLAASATSSVDSTVVPGAGYCYAVTAIGANGIESGLSNIVQNLQIPPAPPTALAGVVN